MTYIEMGDITSNSTFAERIEESADVLAREGVEPQFFARISETGLDFSPVYRGEKTFSHPLVALSKYLFPEYDNEQLDAVLSSHDARIIARMDRELSRVVLMAHFHPEGVLQPSAQDLMVNDDIYIKFVSAGSDAPLQIIGSSSGSVDLLFIEQKRPLDTQKITPGFIDELTEKYIILVSLPLYFVSHDVPETGLSELRNSLDAMRKLPPHQFFPRIREYAEAAPYQKQMSAFRVDFRNNLTALPGYAEAVVMTIQSLGCYKASRMTYDRNSRRFA